MIVAGENAAEPDAAAVAGMADDTESEGVCDEELLPLAPPAGVAFCVAVPVLGRPSMAARLLELLIGGSTDRSGAADEA